MKNLLIIVFFVTFSSKAQFAKIVDKEGYVNVREKADAKSQILDTVKSDDYVYIVHNKEGDSWQEVFYSKKEEQYDGFIHKSRLKYLNELPSIDYVVTKDNVMIFDNRKLDIQIRINVCSFEFQKNKQFFDYDSGFYHSYKRKRIWGTDGEKPLNAYESILISHKGREYYILESEFENFFNPTIIYQKDQSDFIDIRFDEVQNTITISSLNSDGAGAYVLFFVIKNLNLIDKKVITPF